MRVDELNHWWTEKAVRKDFALATHRSLFKSIAKDFGRRQIQIVVGLRRVGKSTILFQLADALIARKTNPLHILYCSFDEPELQEKRIEDILKEYSRLTGVDYKREKIYLFLDEVQKAKEWVADVKLVYDNLKNVKVVISGSASLNIVSEAKTSLAGRAIYYELQPLDFHEFLKLKNIQFEERAELYRDVLEREFDKFVLRSFPEIVNETDTGFIKKYVRNSVIDPILLKDIPKEFQEVDVILMEKLVTVFMSNPGQYLSIDDLARELGRAKTTLYKALFYLEFSFLLRKVLNFRPSIRAASRKLSRIYPYHPSLTLPFDVPDEKFAECLVLSQLRTDYYWREKEKEIDFLTDSIPVEVKLKSKIEKDDTRWINYFVKKYGKKLNIKKAYIITKTAEGKEGMITLIPLWKFCFEGLR